ncbi:MAG TPA: Crp/Fnr family transcriptional regulator [Longimicrobiales bacterium]|nr:Crp/Fnr family transcriptional regulator [Longimicrobiales bacterium]
MPLRVVPVRDRKLHRQVKKAEIVPLRRGEALHRPGDAADHVVLVRRGHLRLISPGRARGGDRIVDVAGPWEITGEEALLSSSVRRYRAVAGEVSAIQRLEPDRVLSVLATSRVTRQAFHAAWLSDLALLRHLSTGSGRPDVASRLAAVLLHLAERLGQRGEHGMLIPLRLTHRTLADLAGAHRSTVTTLLNAWLYEGWLGEPEWGIRIDEPPALRALAGLPPTSAGS